MRKSVFFVGLFLFWSGRVCFGQGNCTYTVKSGDNFFKIAQHHNISIDRLKNLNPQITNKNLIFEGQKINVPCSSAEIAQEETQETHDINTDTNTKSKETKDRKKSKKKETGKTSLWWLWLIVGCVGGIFVWEKWCRKKIIGNKESNSNNLYLYDGEKKRLEEENGNLKNQIKQIQKEKQSLEKEKNDIWEENVKLREEIESLKNTIKSEPIPAQNIQTASLSESGTLYAVSIIDGYLQRVKDTANEDTVFELCLKSATKADITIYKSAYEKILDNPSHLEGCDKQIVGRTSVNVEQAGEAEREDNGKWRVTKRVKVLVQ